MDIECWEGEHLSWGLTIGILLLLIWVIGAPVALFIYLRKKRYVLSEIPMKRKFRMFYEGYTEEAYYFEAFNIARKILLILINVFVIMFTN